MNKDALYQNAIGRMGAALEAEDRLLLGSGLVRGEAGGILRLVNERYYQFVLWRASLAHWRAEVEYGAHHDLVLFSADDPGKMWAIFELKLWTTDYDSQLPSFRVDLDKLRSAISEHAAFILISANQRGKMAENIAWLHGRWSQRGDFAERSGEPYSYCFNTIGKKGEELELWMAIWPLR